MICEKKEASVFGLTKVVEFFFRHLACVVAILMKMSKDSRSFPAALALRSCLKRTIIWLGVTISFLLFFLESLVVLGLLWGSGIAREGGWRSLHIWIFESLMSATGRLVVRRALAVLKLLLSMAIWAAFEVSGGWFACSLGVLDFTFLESCTNCSICPDLNMRMRSWTTWLIDLSRSWFGASTRRSKSMTNIHTAVGSESSAWLRVGGLDASTQHSMTSWNVCNTSVSKRKLI